MGREGRGMSQRPSFELRLPPRSVWLFLITFMVVLSRIAMQPSSHNWPSDSKEELWRSSKTRECCAVRDKELEKGRIPEWVAVMVLLSGYWTWRPKISGFPSSRRRVLSSFTSFSV